jgi:hypothetical protein
MVELIGSTRVYFNYPLANFLRGKLSNCDVKLVFESGSDSLLKTAFPNEILSVLVLLVVLATLYLLLACFIALLSLFALFPLSNLFGLLL